MSQSRFERRPARPTLHPKRVTGGVRLQARTTVPPPAPAGSPVRESEANAVANSPTGWTWASSRWMRPAETFAPGDQLAEGLAYAQAGQTRTLEVRPGAISARVQGRMPAAYKTALRLPTFTHEMWELVISAMTQQARYAAAILSGELPANIEDLFAPHGLRLFPADPSDLSPSCTCSVFTGIDPAGPVTGPGGVPALRPPTTPWCKHVCCIMYLIAERLAQQPLLILSLRGMPEADLIDRLRHARALAGMQRAGAGPAGAAPVYAPHIPLADRAAQPLTDFLHDFWHSPDPDALAGIDLSLTPPEVTHPLLRRLGPPPFTGAKFPLVGLLATCYDLISAAVVKGEEK